MDSYDFSMNQLKNRLETFKDWPFTEETGSTCTAKKVIGVVLDCKAKHRETHAAYECTVRSNRERPAFHILSLLFGSFAAKRRQFTCFRNFLNADRWIGAQNVAYILSILHVF